MKRLAVGAVIAVICLSGRPALASSCEDLA